MSKSIIVSVTLLMSMMVAGSALYGQGRGGAPQGGPPPQAEGRGFPGLPPAANRPADLGQPGPNSGPQALHAHGAVFHQVEAKPRLAERLTMMLPDGMTLEQAADGFDNLGGFVSALHVSDRLGIDFSDLKASMMGEDGLPLGAAIQANGGPAMTAEEANEAASQAQQEAEQVIEETS